MVDHQVGVYDDDDDDIEKEEFEKDHKHHDSALRQELKCQVYKLRAKLRVEFYRVPTVINQWGEVQESQKVNYDDLFYDLIFIGIIFKLGNLLYDEISDGHGFIDWETPSTIRGLIWFAVLYLLAIDCWVQKTFFHARYNTLDVFHKFVDLGSSLAVASFASQITSVERFTQETGYNYMLGLSVTKVVFELTQIFTYVEIAYGSNILAARLNARKNLKDRLLYSSFALASIVTSALRLDWRITLLMWFLHTFIARIHAIYVIGFTQIVSKENSIPIHVEYTIHRWGDWTMVMLGEGVFQIIIADIDENYPMMHILTFSVSFLVLAGVMLLHYTIMPHDPDSHALRKSRQQGIFHFQATTIYGMALVCLGVGLKSNLKYESKMGDSKYQKFSWLLFGSLATVLILMLIIKLIHVGPGAIAKNTQKSVLKIRLLLWILRTTLPGLVLIVPSMQLQGHWNAMAGLLVLILVYFLSVEDGRQGDDYRPRDESEIENAAPEQLAKMIRRQSMRLHDGLNL